MKPLYEDQIHTPAWQKLCDYIWAEKEPRGYEETVVANVNPNLKMINGNDRPGASGVIFVGMCHLLENVLQALPTNGNYIVVHRTNDRPYTPFMQECRPPSVKHIYTVDCRGKWDNVTAIPFGVASINGEDEILKKVIKTEYFELHKTRIFACYNVNRDTKHRNESLSFVENSHLVKWIKPYCGQDVFHKLCKLHEFTMALAGCGADASRQWSSMILGSLPIVTDCPEMRHFEDMPLVYCPKDFNEITDEWLDNAKESVKGKNTERLRMSYWANHLNETKSKYGIL